MANMHKLVLPFDVCRRTYRVTSAPEPKHINIYSNPENNASTVRIMT